MVQVNAIFAPFFFSILLFPISFSLSKTTLLNHELTLTFHTLLYSLHFSLFISLSFSPPPLFHPPILYSLSPCKSLRYLLHSPLPPLLMTNPHSHFKNSTLSQKNYLQMIIIMIKIQFQAKITQIRVSMQK